MTDKELDDLFQKTFSEHEMTVPSGMWERVDPQKDTRRRRVFLWWSGLGIAALLVLTGTALWLYHTSSGEALISAKTTSPQTRGSAAQKEMTSPDKPAQTPQDAQSSGSRPNSDTPSQTAHANNNIRTPLQHSYTDQHNGRSQPMATPEKSYSAMGNAAGNTDRNHEDNRNLQDNNGVNSNSSKPAEPASSPNQGETVASPNQSAAPLQKPDSAAIGELVKQESKAAIRVKKMHGEKAASFELMVAGYGNNRKIYDASKSEEPGIIAFGAMPTKEKVLMHSVSISARVDKPLTNHFSIKTGLQFIQTRQRVSYSYETVSQSTIVSSFNTSDTMRFARLESERPVVKGVYNSLNVPVLVSYHTGKGKLSVGATAGVMVNVLSWYNGSVPDAGYRQTIAAKNAFRTRTGASLYAGVTAAKRLGSFQLFAEPHIQYTLSSVTKSTTRFRQKITSYGVGIGIRKTIGK